MPQAIRVIDKVADLSDWDQATFSDGDLVQWNATAGKFQRATTSPPQTIGGLTTTNLPTAGLMGYVSANNTLDKTDASALNSSYIFGVSNSVPGEMIVAGLAVVHFTAVGGQPSPGQKVWLAQGADEANAAGKLTATEPTSGVWAVAGICIDNTTYSTNGTSKILLQVKEPIQL